MNLGDYEYGPVPISLKDPVILKAKITQTVELLAYNQGYN